MKMLRKHFWCHMIYRYIFFFGKMSASLAKKLLVWEKVVHTSRHFMCLSVFSLRNECRSKRTLWEVAKKPKRASTMTAENLFYPAVLYNTDQQPITNLWIPILSFSNQNRHIFHNPILFFPVKAIKEGKKILIKKKSVLISVLHGW